MIGAEFGLRMITGDVVSEAATALGLKTPGPRPQVWNDGRWRWAAIGAGIAALIGALFLLSPWSSL